MTSTKITVDQHAGAGGWSRPRRNSFEVGNRRVKCRGTCFRDEFSLVPKMRIEPTVSQPGPPHHFIHSCFGDPVFPKRLTRSVHDSTPRCLLVSGGIAHIGG